MATKYTQTTLKTLKKGDTFGVLGFTGMQLGNLVVTAAAKEQFKAVKKNGDEIIFDRKTGLQVNCDNEKYANKAVDEYEYERPVGKKKDEPVKTKKKDEPVKAKKKAAPPPDDDEEDDDEEEETPPVKAKTKKDTKKKDTKKKPADDDEDDDGWEDA